MRDEGLSFSMRGLENQEDSKIWYNLRSLFAFPASRRRQLQIQPWAHGASVFVELNESIRKRACQFEAAGLKAMDALHLACAEAADCDWFFTTDAGILKKARGIAGIRVANPVEFVGEV